MTAANIPRRSFLSLLASPAIVRASSLMPLWLPTPMLWLDGKRDDADALEVWMNGGRVLGPDGRPMGMALTGQIVLLSRQINVRPANHVWDMSFCDIHKAPGFRGDFMLTFC